jgi:hypothetical protein
VAAEHQPAWSWTDTDLCRREVRHGAETVLAGAPRLVILPFVAIAAA